LEALAGRLSRNLGRLSGAIAFAALIIGGTMLLLTPMGGWHHMLGEGMILSGIIGMIVGQLGALRRYHDRP
jgi:Na+-transporting NADH:ubiquinone oxidoreductase subunit NqrB